MTGKLFDAALGVGQSWLVSAVEFDVAAKVLTVLIDVKPGSRFALSGHAGEHPVHDNCQQDLPAPELLTARAPPAGARLA